MTLIQTLIVMTYVHQSIPPCWIFNVWQNLMFFHINLYLNYEKNGKDVCHC